MLLFATMTCSLPTSPQLTTTSRKKLNGALTVLELLPNVLRDIVVGYAFIKIFREPRLVTKLTHDRPTSNPAFHQGSILLIGLDKDNKRTIASYDPLDLGGRKKIQLEAHRDRSLHAFGMYRDVHIFAEKNGNVVLRGGNDGREILTLLGVFDDDELVKVAPNASDNGIVCLFSWRKLVLICVKHRASTVVLLENRKRRENGVSFNEAGTLLACGGLGEPVKILQVRRNPLEKADLVEHSTVYELFRYSVMFISNDVLAIERSDGEFVFYRVHGEAGGKPERLDSTFNGQGLQHFLYHPAEDMVVAFSCWGDRKDHGVVRVKPFFGATRILILNSVGVAGGDCGIL